jgi:hypothetical protein
MFLIKLNVFLAVPCEYQTRLRIVLFVPPHTFTHFNKAFLTFQISRGFTVRVCHFMYAYKNSKTLFSLIFHGNFEYAAVLTVVLLHRTSSQSERTCGKYV